MTTIPAARVALAGDKHPTTPWMRWFLEVSRRTPRHGSATFSAGTAVAVSLAPPEATATYLVALEPSENNTFWVTSKAADGFTVNADSTTSATIQFTLYRQ